MSDFAAKLDQARARLPLRRLMLERQRGPTNGNWKQFPKCPYCGKDSAGLFQGKRGERFKCHHTSCPSGTAPKGCAWDEVGFLAHELGLSRKEAALTYLKEAGVVREPKVRSPRSEVGEADMEEFSDAELTRADDSDLNDLSSTESAPDGAEPLPGITDHSVESHLGSGVAAVPTMPVSDDERVSASPGGLLSPAIPASPPGEASLSHADSTPGPPAFQTEERMSDTDALKKIKKLLRMKQAGTAAEGEIALYLAAELARQHGIDLAGVDPGRPAEKSEPSKVVLAIRHFYERLTLTREDEFKLWTKRGLTSQTCAALGFKSSLRTNEKILLEMKEQFPVNVLLDAALWTQGERPTDTPHPNTQYCGWGVAGKNKDSGEEEWDWTFPILIPYVNEAGEVIDLRVHKRTQKAQHPRLYLPRPLKGHRDKFTPADGGPADPRFVAWTEGEFKGAALFQALWDQAAIAALPGISMSKPLWGDIEDLVIELGMRRQSIVVFDNEDKSTPGLPGYKEEKWKRFDSEVWARYLARRIARTGFTAKVGHLPNDWRDAKGKADWDGALALLIERSKAGGSSPQEVWDKCSGKIRLLFLEVLREAVAADEVRHLDLFSWQDEEQIQRNLKRIEYDKQLPQGADEEKKIAARLRRMADRLKGDEERLPEVARAFLFRLAGAYNALEGRYYMFNRLQEKYQELWQGHRKRAGANDDVELKRTCEVVLKGIPKAITDFVVEPLYCLLKVDGTRWRVLRIHNIHGEDTDLLFLPSESFGSPKPFREWLLNALNCGTLHAGERVLEGLQADIGAAVALKTVIDVPLRALDSRSGIYFFGDLAITREGAHIRPDRQGLFWHKGTGYRLADRDQEGEEFRLGTPLMHPEIKCSEEETRALFQEATRNFYEAVGNYGGYVCVGMMLSYGLIEEVFKKHSAVPGLWIHGEPASGKTSLARWSFRIWGFPVSDGVTAESTPVGLSILWQQYGSLPAWVDEYQPECEQGITQKLKENFERKPASKKTFGELMRVVRSAALVSGVATSPDYQLRSRYCHVKVAKESRINKSQERYHWFQETSLNRFFLLGRYVLENRPEFARLGMEQLRLWMESQALAHCDSRSKLVHGLAYAGFAATVSLLQSHSAEDLLGFRNYLVSQVGRAVAEQDQILYVNQFFDDFLAALRAGEFGHTAGELRRYAKARVMDESARPPGVTEMQYKMGCENSLLAWKSVRLYFTYDVVDRISAYKKKIGSEAPLLSLNDLRAQMESKLYYVPPENGEGHRQKFDKPSPQRCLCIDLDKHEWGLQPQSDAAFEASLRKPDGNFFVSTEWTDPRRGPLFYIVDSLKGRDET